MIAFYNFMVGCKIQKQKLFPLIASNFANTRNIPKFEQKYPLLEKERSEKCRVCPASTQYNQGLGIDCWFSVPLPIKTDVYDFVYDQIKNRLKFVFMDTNKAKKLDLALGELQIASNSIIGGVQNGWLVDNREKLEKSVRISTAKNEYSISVASVLGYIVRDAVSSPIIHSDILSIIFDYNGVATMPVDSPVHVWKYLFNLSRIIHFPVQVRILKENDFEIDLI